MNMYSLPTVSHQILHITEVDWSCSTIIQINEELRSKKKNQVIAQDYRASKWQKEEENSELFSIIK